MTKDNKGNDEDNDDSDKEANDGAGQLGWRGQLSTQVACSAFGHCTAPALPLILIALLLILGCCTAHHTWSLHCPSYLALALLLYCSYNSSLLMLSLPSIVSH